jgi:hypothetical protein
MMTFMAIGLIVYLGVVVALLWAGDSKDKEMNFIQVGMIIFWPITIPIAVYQFRNEL